MFPKPYKLRSQRKCQVLLDNYKKFLTKERNGNGERTFQAIKK